MGAIKLSAEESKDSYEKILDKTTESIEKFIEKGTKIFPLPDAELDKLEGLAGEYCLMQAKKSKNYAKILKSQMEYLDEYKDWREMTGRFGQGRTPVFVGNVLSELKKMGY